VLSTSPREALSPEEGLKCGSGCTVHKVFEAEEAPKAGHGQSRWRDLCKPQSNGRTRQCLKDPASSFFWWKEDIQSTESHKENMFCPKQKPDSNTSTFVPVLSSA